MTATASPISATQQPLRLALAPVLPSWSDRFPDMRVEIEATASWQVSRAALSAGLQASLEGWLALEAAETLGSDRKMQAAYLIGRIARALVDPVVTTWLTTGCVLLASPVVKPERYRWTYRERSGETIRFVALLPHDAAIGRPCETDAATAMQDAIVVSARPYVETLVSLTGLARAALWRLVADVTCSAFLRIGTQAGEPDRAMAFAEAIIAATPSPLHNRQSGFEKIHLPDPDRPGCTLASRWFLKRGGCCRVYTRPSGALCGICVLHKQPKRHDLLRALLASEYAADSAATQA